MNKQTRRFILYGILAILNYIEIQIDISNLKQQFNYIDLFFGIFNIGFFIYFVTQTFNTLDKD